MKRATVGLIAIAIAIAGYAFAQTVTQTIVPVGQGDLVQIIKGGQGASGNVYAAAGTVAGQQQYQYSVPLTAFTITVTNGNTFVLLNPAGTLATGTITTESNPGDGKVFCVMSSQTQTAITMTANTGQAFAAYGLAAVTALVANTPVCWFYIQNQAVWVRYK